MFPKGRNKNVVFAFNYDLNVIYLIWNRNFVFQMKGV